MNTENRAIEDASVFPLTSNPPIRLGINGFGRIGRCVARMAAQNPHFQIVAVNDLADDVENLVYLYNYDSTYGKAKLRAKS